MRIVILGGGSAGTSIAFELRKKDKDCEIIILEKTSYNEYSPCSLPYVLAGEIESFDKIFLFSDEDYARENITLKKNSNIKRIDAKGNKVFYEKDGVEHSLEYDYLVYALGSSPTMPPIQVSEDAKYHFLRTIDDAKYLKENMSPGGRVVVLGSGLIGTEAAYCAAHAKMDVTIIECYEHLLITALDNDMASHVEEYLRSIGIRVYKGTSIRRIDGKKLYSENEEYDYDILVLATGLTPSIQLAKDTGIRTNKGIIVDSAFKTSISNIYAAGDCIELPRLYDDNDCIMLGSLAYQSARVIADNILGNKASFKPVLGAAIAKMGGIIIASTGLTLERARKKGIKAYGMIIEGSTRSGYHPEAKRIIVKIVANTEYEIIGAQIVGGEDVGGRINLCSLAIAEKMTLDKIAFLETVYNPGSAPINEPLSICARMLIRKIDVVNNAA